MPKPADPIKLSSAAQDRDKLLRNYVASRVGQIPVAVGELLDENERLRDALTGIANADTKYPSMPSGFTGDWEVLRDEARAVLTEDELGVWE